jgi:DNA-directed RNA polymerase subunit RPC12/RpoP
MPTIICAKCNKKMVNIKSGAKVIECTEDGMPYKIFNADVMECPKCQFRVCNTAIQPFTEHWIDNFARHLQQAKENIYTTSFDN